MKKNIYVNYGVQATLSAITFIYSLVFLKILGAAGFGEYSIFYSSIAFFVLLFGINLSSVLPFFIVNRKTDPEKFLFTTAIYLVAVTVLVYAFLSISDDAGISKHIFPGGMNLRRWILFFCLQFFFIQLNQLFTSYLNVHKIFIKVSLFVLFVNILMVAFWLLFSFGFFSSGYYEFDLIWIVFIAGNAVISMYLLGLVLQVIPKLPGWPLLGLKEIRDILKFTMIVYACNTIQFLTYRIDLYFINAFHPGTAVGKYALALSLSQIIWVLPNVISTVMINYITIANRSHSLSLGIKYASFSLYASILIASLLAGGLYFFLPLLYGPQASDIFWLSCIMFAGTMLFSMSIILANMNSGIGFIKLNLYATVITFALSFVLDLILIPSYGMYGAAVIKVIVYIVGLIIQIIFGRQNYQLPWKALFRVPRLRDM